MLYLKEKQKELDEDIIITLISKDPQAPKNLVRFDGNKKEFVKIRLVACMIDHLDIESTILHKDSEEAKTQLELEAASTVLKSNVAKAFNH